jgi:tRNA(Ile)-lysidine synthase
MNNHLEHRFSEFVVRKKLFDTGNRVLVAVSGGLDSMVLLALLMQWRRKFSLDLGVVHLNHQIRGKDAEADARLVTQFCQENRLPVFLQQYPVSEYAKEVKLSLEEAGHLLRKEIFEKIATENSYDKIATGHHQDDQAETLLMRLMGGAGLQGLAGIRLKQGKWVRPLLFATREELASYAKTKKILFREDFTNKDVAILRNKIRHQLLPLMHREYDNAISLHLTQISAILEEWDQYLDEELGQIIPDLIKQMSENKIRVGMPSFKFYFSWIKIHVTEYILKKISREPVKVSYRQFTDFSNWLETAQPGSRFQWDARNFTVKRRKFIEFCNVQAPQSLPFIEIKRPGTSYQIPNKDIKLTLKLVPAEKVRLKVDAEIEYIDGARLEFPLTLRLWRAGDRFKPLGMRSTKLVSDFLTDRKVGWPDRQNVWVLLNKEEIVAVIGYQISDDYKITENSKKIYTIRLRESRNEISKINH